MIEKSNTSKNISRGIKFSYLPCQDQAVSLSLQPEHQDPTQQQGLQTEKNTIISVQ